MPPLPPSQSRLRRFFKWTLICLIVVGAIWAGVIIWWQSSQREISPQEVMLYLIALPVTVLAGLAAFQWFRHRNPAGLSAPASLSADDVTAGSTDKDEDDSTQLAILGAWCLTSAGNNLDDFHQALLEKKQRPVPDPGLLGDDGYPLFAARIREIDAALLEEQADSPAREAFLRTHAMLSRLLEQVEADWPLAPPSLRQNATENGLATLRGIEPAARSQEPQLQLQVKLITPADFGSDEQQQALAWLNETAAALPVAAGDTDVEIVPAQDDATALLLAERFRKEAGDSARALLIIAGESSLCPSTVERLESDRRLFGHHRPHGLMPGEAAFAILCVNRQAMPFALLEPACTLGRVVSCKRTASADGGGKPSHSDLEAVTGAALEAAKLDGDAIGAIACDADHRSSRVLECIGAMLQHTPQLDAIANRLAVNETCGHTGAASSAGGWVAGVAQTQRTGQPVLVFNVSHAFERAAAVLLPAGEYAPPA